MIGKQPRNTDQVQAVSPETLLPQNHLLRRLHAALDLSFVRDWVAPFYSEIGRRSVDPEVVARIWILQYFYGFSEREVCEEVTMHAGFRWFCGLCFSEESPGSVHPGEAAHRQMGPLRALEGVAGRDGAGL